MARKSSTARAAEDNELDVDYSERAGFLTGKAAAIAEWSHRKEKKAFAKVCNVLKACKWQRENPERKRRNGLAYWQRHRDELTVKHRLRQRRKRAKEWKPDTTVYTCKGCGTQWCRVLPKPAGDDLTRRSGGRVKPQFCSGECNRKWRYEQKKQDPAWVEDKRRRAREYYERTKSQRPPQAKDPER